MLSEALNYSTRLLSLGLASGAWVVEASAGNTAIALTLAAKERKFRVICVMPETQAEEKKARRHLAPCSRRLTSLTKLTPDLLRALQSSPRCSCSVNLSSLGSLLSFCFAQNVLRMLGAIVLPVPFQKVSHPNHYTRIAARVAKHLGGFYCGQFDNIVSTASRRSSDTAHHKRPCGSKLGRAHERAPVFSCSRTAPRSLSLRTFVCNHTGQPPVSF